MSKVNTKLLEDKHGNVVLRAIKDINPGEEFLFHFVSFSGRISKE